MLCVTLDDHRYCVGFTRFGPIVITINHYSKSLYPYDCLQLCCYL